MFFVVMGLMACEGSDHFFKYYREEFPVTAIGSETTKTFTFENPSKTKVQHISVITFTATSNTAGHFRVDKVRLNDEIVANKDIAIPVGAIVSVDVIYSPRNLDTTIATYAGWSTGEPVRYIPQKPKDPEVDDATKSISRMLTKTEISAPEPEEGDAIHRAILGAQYDFPSQGLYEVELVGYAVPGPNGEISVGGGGGAGAAACPATGGIACYVGNFSIELPTLMPGKPEETPMPAPVLFHVQNGAVRLDMDDFPAVLFVLKGNGPGEPLEGQPISAVSIVIGGAPDKEATGTFDGSALNVSGATFRVRVVLGEIKQEDVTPGLAAAVDFTLPDCSITTETPFANGSITLKVDKTLSDSPAGNPLFDQFLGGAQVVVTMKGELIIH